MDLKIKSVYVPAQHQVIGFQNRKGQFLQRGTNWFFKKDSGYSSSL
jgi:hypothetical protein